MQAGALGVVEAQLAGWLDGLLQGMEASFAAGAAQARQAAQERHRAEETERELRRRQHDASHL